MWEWEGVPPGTSSEITSRGLHQGFTYLLRWHMLRDQELPLAQSTVARVRNTFLTPSQCAHSFQTLALGSLIFVASTFLSRFHPGACPCPWVDYKALGPMEACPHCCTSPVTGIGYIRYWINTGPMNKWAHVAGKRQATQGSWVSRVTCHTCPLQNSSGCSHLHKHGRPFTEQPVEYE